MLVRIFLLRDATSEPSDAPHATEVADRADPAVAGPAPTIGAVDGALKKGYAGMRSGELQPPAGRDRDVHPGAPNGHSMMVHACMSPDRTALPLVLLDRVAMRPRRRSEAFGDGVSTLALCDLLFHYAAATRLSSLSAAGAR